VKTLKTAFVIGMLSVFALPTMADTMTKSNGKMMMHHHNKMVVNNKVGYVGRHGVRPMRVGYVGRHGLRTNRVGYVGRHSLRTTRVGYVGRHGIRANRVGYIGRHGLGATRVVYVTPGYGTRYGYMGSGWRYGYTGYMGPRWNYGYGPRMDYGYVGASRVLVPVHNVSYVPVHRVSYVPVHRVSYVSVPAPRPAYTTTIHSSHNSSWRPSYVSYRTYNVQHCSTMGGCVGFKRTVPEYHDTGYNTGYRGLGYGARYNSLGYRGLGYGARYNSLGYRGLGYGAGYNGLGYGAGIGVGFGL